MPKSKPEAPAQDPIEQDFLAAIKRLEEGHPRSKELKKRAALGILKINVSTVAIEAGRSRTLIALDDKCRYPRVRALILQEKGVRNALPSTQTELISNLRADKAEFSAQAKLFQAEALEHFKARCTAEKALKQAEARLARLLRQSATQGKVVHITTSK